MGSPHSPEYITSQYNEKPPGENGLHIPTIISPDIPKSKLEIGHDDEESSSLSSEYVHWLTGVRRWTRGFISNNKTALTVFGILLFVGGYSVYLGFAIDYDYDKAVALIVITAVVVFFVLYSIIKKFAGKQIYRYFIRPPSKAIDWAWPCLQWFVLPALMIAIAWYLSFRVVDTTAQFQALIGLLVFLFIPYITCTAPTKIQWKPVIMGLLCQFLMAIALMRWDTGWDITDFLYTEWYRFRSDAYFGAKEVFGDPFYIFHPYPMMLLPVIVFFCAVSTMLYYAGVLTMFVRKMGWLMKMIFGVTPIEGTSIFTSMFFGVNDSYLTYRFYIKYLTKAEFFTFLVGCHAGIASYMYVILTWFSANPRHIINASFISAPAALAISKLHYPETKKSKLKDNDKVLQEIDHKGTDVSFVQSGSNAAYDGGVAAAAFIVSTIFVLGTQEFLESVVEWLGERVDDEWSMRICLGRIFQPVAYILGVEWEETYLVGGILGMKFFWTETKELGYIGSLRAKDLISERSAVIATYATHGTAGLGYLVIFTGVWMAVLPDTGVSTLYSRFIPRLWLCAQCTCFFTAAMAGLFYTDDLAHEQYIEDPNGLMAFLWEGIPGYTTIMNLLGA